MTNILHDGLEGPTSHLGSQCSVWMWLDSKACVWHTPSCCATDVSISTQAAPQSTATLGHPSGPWETSASKADGCGTVAWGRGLLRAQQRLGDSGSISVCSGCANRIPWTKWLGQQTFISHTSGGCEGQNPGASWFSVWWGPSSWFAEGHVLAVSSRSKERVFSPRVSCKGTNPIMRSLSLSHDQLINSQEPHLLILSHWGLGFYHINLGEGTNIQPIARRVYWVLNIQCLAQKGRAYDCEQVPPADPLDSWPTGRSTVGLGPELGPLKLSTQDGGRMWYHLAHHVSRHSVTYFRADRETRDEAVWQRHRAVSGKATL